MKAFYYLSLFVLLALAAFAFALKSNSTSAQTRQLQAQPTPPRLATPTLPYTVTIDPANFVKVVDNPYFPLTPGTTYIYEGVTKKGKEHVEVTITSETKVILGVPCVVVKDTVTVDGQIKEGTTDWYAQDKQGNVWYFGEETAEYVNGKVSSTQGAWLAGVNGAQPGIIMPAKPIVGEPYRQEYLKGEAEDMAQVLSLRESATVPVGSYQDVLKTIDWTPLDPTAIETKFYAKGVGNILTHYAQDPSWGLPLVEIKKANSKPVELLPQPTSGFPPGIAPESARVDIAKPTFSKPGEITNALLPITQVDQLIQIGQKGGKPHRTEFTLLPGTKKINWLGEQTETRVLQFVAYLDGRILETALDFLAQADGGAVWYFGEDVANYENGTIVDHGGTWRAGKDVPPAMIMPANPQPGNVYRVENIPGNVFEEVTVKAINQTLEGPRGLVNGVMFVQQIGLDGKTTVKAFVPGYGEFLAHTEDAAVAVPTDTLSKPLSAELKTMLTSADTIFNTAPTAKWDALSASLETFTTAWQGHREAIDLGSLFPLLNTQMERALDSLTKAVEKQDRAETQNAAFDVAIATLDLQMPYRTRTEIDLARFDLWTRRVAADSAANDAGAVAGDVAVLQLIWDRVGHTVEQNKAKSIGTQLSDLRAAADKKDLSAASNAAATLEQILVELGIGAR